MRSRLVLPPDWAEFFDEFTRRHEGSPTTVWVIDPRLGAQVEAKNLPLQGIGTPAGTLGPISIQLGTAGGSNVEHPVRSPGQVWVELTEEGVEAALEIRSEGGRRTILEFRDPAVFDGAAPR